MRLPTAPVVCAVLVVATAPATAVSPSAAATAPATAVAPSVIRSSVAAPATAAGPPVAVVASAADGAPADATPPPDRAPRRVRGHLAAPAPVCGDRDGPGLPLRAVLDNGPSTFPRGGYWRAWHLKLTNTTRRACRAVHPVVVITGRDGDLRPRHIRFEFYDDRAERWRAVRFETTDADENVGAFTGEGFGGFTVEPGRTLTTALRARFTGGAPVGPATASVTTVQRRGDDGDWVGQSGDVPFRVTEGDGGTGEAGDGDRREEPDPAGPGDAGRDPEADPDDGPGGRREPGTGADREGVQGPDGEPGAARGDGSRDGTAPGGSPAGGADEPDAGRPGAGEPGAAGPFPPPELARTGPPEQPARGTLLPLTLAGAGCLLGGSALLALARRLRHR
ncbi:hypothetical protein IHE55_09950 [Streptomyces pactum]|uniref:Gram-positive cocci surface proteins LPxTG domain-containing protein n=1 Tax=Streptomyces pactum TaxID=68249 RepID=A0ABS0NIX3_9ACTN|nr:hypothetical protein [Streptomyces pactum]MBH5335101.1 hypothetical protein [Streptomyces pactum]